MGNWYYGDYYKPSKPREVKGGIRSQSKAGGFGKSWWAKRWIAVLEGFYDSARLARGRSYARNGQVISIDIDKGKVSAKVQGSRRTPYNVKIEVKTLSRDEWKKLAKNLSEQVIFAAKLFAGEMPENIEEVFFTTGLSLLPAAIRDLKTDCSCPDWSNPCKHIAAVHYLLGEEFDRDPFLIFKLRGIDREELIDLMGGEVARPASLAAEASIALPPEPLSAEFPAFWQGGEVPDDLFGEVRTPPMHAALPRQLGNFPFWRGDERLLDALELMYAKASPASLRVFLGEREVKEPHPAPIKSPPKRPIGRLPKPSR